MSLFPEIDGCTYHHSALKAGYVSRKSDGYVTSYRGRFGTGYLVHKPNWKSSNYHIVDYYIKEDNHDSQTVSKKFYNKKF